MNKHKLFAIGLISGLLLMLVILPAPLAKASSRFSIATEVSDEAWIQNVLETRYKVKYPDSSILASVILKASEKEQGNPILTLAQINTESHFKYWKRSSENAEGYMQVVKKHWVKDCPQYNPSDRYQNIYAGLCALRVSTNTAGNISDGLVIYNIGQDNWKRKRFLKSGNTYRTKVFQEYYQLLSLRATEVSLD